MTAATWYFYGTCLEEPSVGDFAARLVRTGSQLLMRRPVLAEGRPVGHEPADLGARLRGSSLYVMTSDAPGALSFTCQAPSHDTLEAYESIALEAKPPTREITSVGSLAAFDRGPRGFYRALARSTMAIIAELLPRGVAVGEDATALAFEALAVEQVAVETDFRLLGHLHVASSHEADVSRLVTSHPLLSQMATMQGRVLSIQPCRVRLTEEEWGELHELLLRCAAVSRHGFARVACGDRWDAVIPARL